MTYTKSFLALIILFLFANSSNAQYKRRGETLQTRGKSATSKKTKADYSLSQLKGKWQEFQRLDRRDSSSVTFTDTIQLNFTDSNKVRTRTSVVTSMTLDGEANIDNDNTLTVAADEYTIKSLSSAELVLDDNDKFVHHLKKMDKFWYETLGKVTAPKEDFSKPVNVSLANIVGKWTVYRRQAKPGATNEHEALIKNLNILKKTGASAASGEIIFYQNETVQRLPCTVTVTDTEIRVVCSLATWSLSVYQSDAGNFVFGSSELMYFSKKS